jgi:hypothetical protein
MSNQPWKTILAMGVGMGLVFAYPGAIRAQGYVYPAQNQSPQQQRADEYECHAWSVQQTGVDPTRPTYSQQGSYSSSPSARPLRGAAGGAALGAMGGAIAGNAGKGAAIGAAIGFLGGGIRRHEQRRKQEQQRAAAQAQQQALVNEYNRARAACLQGRGYTVR